MAKKNITKSYEPFSIKNIAEQWIADTIEKDWDEVEDQSGPITVSDGPQMGANLAEMFLNPEDWLPEVFAPCKDIPAALDIIQQMGEKGIQKFVCDYLKNKLS